MRRNSHSALPSLLLAAAFGALSMDARPPAAGGPAAPSHGRAPAGAPGLGHDGPSSLSGHDRMLALLEAIARKTPEENPFLGRGDLPKLKARLKSLPPESAFEERWELGVRIGLEEMRLGNLEVAMERLRSALDLAGRLPPDVRAYASVMASYQLGVVYLRWGERQNCVALHTSESCILPIRGGGIHRNPEGSRRAAELLHRVAAATPPRAAEHLAARWLLNIAHMTLGGYPQDVPAAHRIPPETFRSDEPFPRFPEVASRAGLDAFNLAGGAAVDDFDGDGLLDVVVTSSDPAGQMRFFHNAGDGTFPEATERAGLKGILGGLNLNHADYDNDGDLDLLVLRGGWWGRHGRHPLSLLRNDGSGRFTDVTFEAGLGEAHYPTQAAGWADYDNDGDLDLFVGSEGDLNEAYPSRLFRNEGNGAFTERAREAGVENLRLAKGVAWGDYDGDGRPDLFVSNMAGENRLYHNDGGGTFTDVAPAAGVTAPRDSFPAWFWDFDNDGVLDLYVATFAQGGSMERLAGVASSYLGLPHRAEPARLYRGDGRGGFRDVAASMNLTRVTITMGSNFGDLDNDGWLDFYLGTGYPAYDGLIPNVMYRSRRGRGFADVTTDGGFGHLQKGHGTVFADLDGDGDQDVFEEMGGAYAGDGYRNVLYENPGFGRAWIVVKAAGVRSNRSGFGARIRADFRDGDERRTVFRHVGTAGSFGSNPLGQHLGLGAARAVDRIEIHWPASGTTQEFRDVAVNQTIEVTEGSAVYRVVPGRAFRLR